MTCTRDTYIADWQDQQAAVTAWQECECIVCKDALEYNHQIQ